MCFHVLINPYFMWGLLPLQNISDVTLHDSPSFILTFISIFHLLVGHYIIHALMPRGACQELRRDYVRV